MPLTPEDVRNKRFTPVRLREGYDMGEVDQFLDEVEAELERLTVENEELRAKVSAASRGEATGIFPAVPPAVTPAPVAPAQTFEAPIYAEPVAVPVAPLEAAPIAPSAPFAPIAPAVAESVAAASLAGASASGTSIGDASAAAARLLEIASANADQLLEQAKDEADRIVGEARSKAERITNEARGKADRLETEARIRAQKLDDETNERRASASATIERERYEIQREVEHLRAYEREYRARIKNYFQTQLDQLATNDNAPSEMAPSSGDGRRARFDEGF